MYRWFSVVPQGLVWPLPFSFLVIFGVLFCDFCGVVMRVIFCGILVGCHVWGPCASLAGDFAPRTPLNQPQLWWFFWAAQVHGLEGQDPRFPLIESISVRLLWGRGCPGGNPGIPKVSLHSVGWIGRSGDGKLRVHPRPFFWVGQSNRHKGTV
jgi:hypothetical protein